MRARNAACTALFITIISVVVVIVAKDDDDDDVMQVFSNVEVETYEPSGHPGALSRFGENDHQAEMNAIDILDRVLPSQVADKYHGSQGPWTDDDLSRIAQGIGKLELIIEKGFVKDPATGKSLAKHLIELQQIYYQLLNEQIPTSIDAAAQARLFEYKRAAAELLKDLEGSSVDDRREALANLKRRLLNKG